VNFRSVFDINRLHLFALITRKDTTPTHFFQQNNPGAFPSCAIFPGACRRILEGTAPSSRRLAPLLLVISEKEILH